METKELKAKDIPMGYALCFNDACNRKDTCMHYLANMLTNQQERFIGQAVYPTAWQNGECRCYCEAAVLLTLMLLLGTSISWKSATAM